PFFILKLRRSAIAISLASAIVTLPRLAPKGARSLVCARSYKHLAPLERKRILLLHFKLESTICHLCLCASVALNCSIATNITFSGRSIFQAAPELTHAFQVSTRRWSNA